MSLYKNIVCIYEVENFHAVSLIWNTKQWMEINYINLDNAIVCTVLDGLGTLFN